MDMQTENRKPEDSNRQTACLSRQAVACVRLAAHVSGFKKQRRKRETYTSMRKGFDNEKYLKMQSEHIRERISQFDNKLYLEFGGKLYDDYHASRVLPGFEPDSKLRMLMQLAEVRGDLGITYDSDLLRLKSIFESKNLYVGSVCITHFAGQYSAQMFQSRLEKMGVKVYRHYLIPGYPNNIPTIVSEEGYGHNEYIETTKPLVVVTAPGPGSGKMATCLSQLYHEHKRGIRAGYAKYETFPIWNLPLSHPVNLAYEAATADLNDVNMIDPYHLEAYGKSTVNYNRDVEIFPVLKAIFMQIYGDCPYQSPTDMGVNMAGNCIVDDEVCREASCQEIIRRYYHTLVNIARGKAKEEEAYKIELLMNKAGITTKDRKVVEAAPKRAEETGDTAAALELPDGRLITGKTSELLGACSALLIKALKVLADIDRDVLLITPNVILPIEKLKVYYLGSSNPLLHMEDVVIALSASSESS